MFETGQPAPDFTPPDQDGEPVTLSELRVRPVMLYLSPDGRCAASLKT